MSIVGTFTKPVKHVLDLLGSARAENDAINSLTDQLATARSEASRYRVNAQLWKNTAREIQDELDEARPLIAYAKSRKASIAAYEQKRKGA